MTMPADDTEFRDELRAWLSTNLRGEFAAIRGVGGPADDTAWDLRLEWERKLAEARWLNVSWPLAYGGRGASPSQELMFHLEHARAGAPYWCGVQGRDMIGPALLHFGTEAQRQRFLPPITAVEEFWGQGFSEPDAGSDLARLRTVAERDGDEWVVNGQKIWMTFGARAQWLYVLCRTDRMGPPHTGISMLLIPVDQPGVEIRPIRNIAGSYEFAEAFFTDARTASENVVGEVNDGWRITMAMLANERGGTTVLPFQAAFEREVNELIALARACGVDKQPVIRQKLVRAWEGLRLMQLNTDGLVQRILEGQVVGPESSINKLHWTYWHRSIGELMMEVLGAGAMVVDEGGHLTRWHHTFISSRSETIYGGTSEIQRNILAERVLGLPKEPRPSV